MIQVSRFFRKIASFKKRELDREIPELSDCGLAEKVYKKYVNAFEKLNIQPCRIEEMSLNQLNVGISFDYDEVLKKFFRTKEGSIDRLTCHSFLCDFLLYYIENGWSMTLKNIKELDYFKYFMECNRVGYKTNFFNGEKIPVKFKKSEVIDKARRFIGVYESIKEGGYLAKPYHAGMYVCVSKTPFPVSRMGMKTEYQPWDIFIGNHRVAAMICAGIKKAPVIVFEDNAPV